MPLSSTSPPDADGQQQPQQQQSSATAPTITSAVPRKRRLRHRQQDPIVCDEVSQHGGGGGTNAHDVQDASHKDTTNVEDLRDAFSRTMSATTITTASTTRSATDTSASCAGASDFLAGIESGIANADTFSKEPSVPLPSLPPNPPPSTDVSQSSSSIRAEPQLPSCRADRPGRSCMIVKSNDESVHSVGLSHHRQSGKNGGRRAAGTCSRSQPKRSSGTTACTAGITTIDSSSSRQIDDELSVSFRTIEVREFPILIGDNPCVAEGPPLSISWEPDCELSIDIEEFEDYRNGDGRDCCRRRTGEELRLDSQQRKYMALESGHSYHDIAAAVRKVSKDRRLRRRSVHNNSSRPFYAFDVAKESATRKLKRLVLGQKKDSALYKEFVEARSRALADMTISEEEAESGACIAEEADKWHPAVAVVVDPNTAIVIEEDSTHRGSKHYFDE